MRFQWGKVCGEEDSRGVMVHTVIERRGWAEGRGGDTKGSHAWVLAWYVGRAEE